MKLRALSAGLAATVALAGLTTPAYAKPTKNGQQPIATFGVMADIHINSGSKTTNNLNRAIAQMYANTGDLDAIVSVGDLTDHGTPEQYDKLMATMKNAVQPGTQTIYTMGNHETYNGLSREATDKLFVEKTGMPALNTHNVVEGFHLIGLNWSPSASDVAWLEDQLAEAAAADKHAPIFVFFHIPLSDTVYGSDEWGMDNQAMYDVLAKYPQAITFSGHSHYANEDPRGIMQKDFTAVNTGIGLNYLELERGRLQGNIPEGAGDLAQDLMVNVYPNRVEIARFDVHTGQPTGEPWVIKRPAKTNKFDYTADRDKVAPKWTTDARVTAEGTGLRTAKVSFNQATDNLLVHHYELNAVNTATGKVDATSTAFSEFYRDPVPSRLTFDINGLTPGANYRIEVVAVDSFGNRSQPTSATAATDALEFVGLNANPAIVQSGTPGTVDVVVKNWGPTPASGTVQLKADGPVTLEPTSVQINAGTNETVTVPVKVTATGTDAAVATITGSAQLGGRDLGTKSTKVFVNHLLGETFDSVQSALKPAVDEKIGFDGFTHEGPNGWTVTNSSTMPQGTTEWQGWSFTTQRFWVAADNQDRDKFTLSSGVIAVADPDEWDDTNSPASKGRFDSRLSSPQVAVEGGKAYTLAFDSHYLQENPQRAEVVAYYDNGTSQTLMNYGPTGENNGQHAMNQTVTRNLNAPADAKNVRIEFRMFDAGNNWYWGIDNVRLS